MEERITTINKKIKRLASSMVIRYSDPGIMLLQADRKINESLFSDGPHPNENGYDLLGREISKILGDLH